MTQDKIPMVGGGRNMDALMLNLQKKQHKQCNTIYRYKDRDGQLAQLGTNLNEIIAKSCVVLWHTTLSLTAYKFKNNQHQGNGLYKP